MFFGTDEYYRASKDCERLGCGGFDYELTEAEWRRCAELGHWPVTD